MGGDVPTLMIGGTVAHRTAARCHAVGCVVSCICRIAVLQVCWSAISMQKNFQDNCNTVITVIVITVIEITVMAIL